jgi:hypothetical protein
MIPLENIEVRPTETRGRKFTFGLFAKAGNNETLKAAKYQGAGLVPAHHESCIPSSFIPPPSIPTLSLLYLFSFIFSLLSPFFIFSLFLL